jgi:hypothetical protein
MTLLLLLDLLLIALIVVVAFRWMRRTTPRSTRAARAWRLMFLYALLVPALWWVGLGGAGYPLLAALLVGGGVAALHLLFVGLVVWLAAQRPD